MAYTSSSDSLRTVSHPAFLQHNRLEAALRDFSRSVSPADEEII